MVSGSGFSGCRVDGIAEHKKVPTSNGQGRFLCSFLSIKTICVAQCLAQGAVQKKPQRGVPKGIFSLKARRKTYAYQGGCEEKEK